MELCKGHDGDELDEFSEFGVFGVFTEFSESGVREGRLTNFVQTVKLWFAMRE